ncbi:shikimate kinase [Magnetococcales bacterium HHB-1]
MNVAIIGMRGTGKSNISRRLSVWSKRPVLSTDLLIEYEQNGLSITEIVEQYKGDWRPFRELEYQVVKRAGQLHNIIIDCGGGVVVDLDTKGNEVHSHRKVEALRKNGVIVWLRGDIPRLVEKVQKDPKRPALTDPKSVTQLMEQRLPFYEEAADRIIDIEDKSRKTIAKEIYHEFLI